MLIVGTTTPDACVPKMLSIDNDVITDDGDQSQRIKAAPPPWCALNRSWTVIATQLENTNLIDKRRGGAHEKYSPT